MRNRPLGFPFVLLWSAGILVDICLPLQAVDVVQPHVKTSGWRPSPVQLATDIQFHLGSISSFLPALDQGRLHVNTPALISTLQQRITAPEATPGQVYAGLVLMRVLGEPSHLSGLQEYLKLSESGSQADPARNAIVGMERWSSVLQGNQEARRSLARAVAPLRQTLSNTGKFDNEAFESQAKALFDGTLARRNGALLAGESATFAGNRAKPVPDFARLKPYDSTLRTSDENRFKFITLPLSLRQRRDGIIQNLLLRFSGEENAPSASSDVDFPLKPGKAPNFGPKSNSAALVERHIFAVHATHFLPKDGIIRAGASDISTGKHSIESEPPSFRTTIHFTLGELVRDHDGFSWEDNPYAIVLPLGAIKSQLVNLNTYDTFILGDFAFPKEAILVMPKSEARRAPPGVHVEFYEGENGLRAAVDRVIEKYGGWHIKMEAKTPSLDSVGNIGDHNVNTPDFFEPFLRANPYVSFGSHIDSQIGTAFRFGDIEQAINWLMKSYSEDGMTTDTHQMAFQRKYIMYHLRKLEEEIIAAHYPDVSLQAFKQKRDRVLEWLNLVNIDLELRQRHGVALQRADKRILDKAKKLQADPVALKTYLEAHIRELPRSDRSEKLSPSVISENLAGNPLSEMKELTKDLVADGSLDAKGMKTLNALYALRRTMIIDLSQARREGVLDLLDSSLSKPISGDGRHDVFEEVMLLVEPYLDERSARLSTALEILRLPKVRTGTENQYQFRLPTSEPLTLQSLLRVHPETRVVFAEKSPPPPSTALEIIRKLGRVRPEKKVTEYRNYAEAKRAAWDIKWSEERLLKDLAAVSRPMRTTRDLNSISVGSKLTFYEILSRGDYGKLDEVWGKLGLKKEFRAAFPRDSDFWQSQKSLAQIYEMLRAQ